MWARVVEVVLGLWLVLSPFIFRHDPADRALWLSDALAGGAVVVFALAAASAPVVPWPLFRHAHLGNLAVAVWLVGFAYIAGGHPSAPGYQNEILVGLTLLLFAIIPTEADRPPRSWRRYYAQRAQRGAGPSR